jgi:dTDP-4-dehydrorhamnose reductase
MLRLMNERKEIKVVNDQYGSPTWAFDLAQVIISLMRQVDGGKKIPSGVYHFTGERSCTWFEFAGAIYAEGKSLNLLTKPCSVKPCTSGEYPAKVKRPLFSVLEKTKIKKALDIEIPEWKNSLKNYLKLTGEQK